MNKKIQINPGLDGLRDKRLKHRESMKTNKDGSHRAIVEQHSDPEQFIYEIIQNAEDKKATFVKFTLQKDVLEVRHNGAMVFNYADVEKITTFDYSPKQDEPNRIGKFGVGFKAVFKITDCPHIHSGKYHFSIEHLFIPKPIEPRNIDKDTLFIMPLKQREIATIKERLVNKFSELKIKREILLFLKNIDTLVFSHEGNEEKLHLKRSIKKLPKQYQNKFKVIEVTDNKSENNWSFLIIESNRNIAKTDHKVQIAFRKEKRKLVEIKNTIFVFFPTSEKNDFSFLVHAPYKTTPSRETIDFGDKENKVITKILGQLIGDSLPLIRDLNMLTADFFNLLPLDKCNEEEPYATAHNVVIQILKKGKLLPGFKKGTYLYAKTSLYTEEKQIATLFDTEDMKYLLEKSYNWLSLELPQKVCEILFIEQICIQRFADKIDKKFITRKNYKWLIKLYSALLPIKENSWGNHYSSRFNAFHKKPIVPIRGGQDFVAPFDSKNHLQVFLPYHKEASEKQSSFEIIDPVILKHKKAKQFFKEINVSKPMERDEIRTFILPRYEQDNPKVNINQYQKDIIFIANAYAKDKKVAEFLEEIPIVLTESGSYCIPQNPKEIYFSSLTTHEWFNGNKEVEIVKKFDDVKKETQKKIKSLFEKIGCRTTLGTNTDTWSGIHRHGWHEKAKSGFNPNFTICGLDYSLKYISLVRSKIIWKTLLQHHKHLKGIIFTSTSQHMSGANQEEKFSKAGKKISNADWLFDKKGILIKQNVIKDFDFTKLHAQYEKGEDATRDKLINALGMIRETLTREEYEQKLSEEIEIEKSKRKKAEKERDKLRKENQKLQEKLDRTANSQYPYKGGLNRTESNENNDSQASWKANREPNGTSEISCAKKPNPVKPHNFDGHNRSTDNNENDNTKSAKIPAEVGRWGEEEVFHKLCNKYLATGDKVKWINQKGEKQKPYDIYVKRKENPDIYIEVKTTTGQSPHLFEITGAQWHFARQCHQDNKPYQIHAVFNAGTNESLISVLENPVDDFEAGNLDARPLGLRIA